jgi:hypothetical protein
MLERRLAAYVARGEARSAYKRAFDAQLAVYNGKPSTESPSCSKRGNHERWEPQRTRI